MIKNILVLVMTPATLDCVKSYLELRSSW